MIANPETSADQNFHDKGNKKKMLSHRSGKRPKPKRHRDKTGKPQKTWARRLPAVPTQAYSLRTQGPTSTKHPVQSHHSLVATHSPDQHSSYPSLTPGPARRNHTSRARARPRPSVRRAAAPIAVFVFVFLLPHHTRPSLVFSPAHLTRGSRLLRASRTKTLTKPQPVPSRQTRGGE